MVPDDAVTNEEKSQAYSFHYAMMGQSSKRVCALIAFLPILLFLVIIGFFIVLDSKESFENPGLLLIMNFIFAFGTSLYVSTILLQNFFSIGTTGMAAISAGLLLWGFGSIAAVISGISGVSDTEFNNITITIHNCCVCISAALHLTGAFLFYRNKTFNANRTTVVALTYFSVLSFVIIISLFALNGWIPAFFVQNQGGTPLRQLILQASITMYIISAFLMWNHHRGSTTFIFWYCLSLALVVIGLTGVMLQSVHGGITGWLGRSAQFLSGVYMCIAVTYSLRESKINDSSLDEALIGRRRAEEALCQSEERSRLLLEKYNLLTNLSHGIAFQKIITDENGTPIDYQIIDANAAFERMTGLDIKSIIGRTARDVLPGIENDPGDWIVKFGRVALQGDQLCFEHFSRQYQKWFNITAFQTNPGQFGVVFDDITTRKQNEQKLAYDFDAMTRLQKLGARSIKAENLEPVLNEIVDAAVAIGRADFGNIQLIDPVDGDLHIAAQRGLPQWWVEFWNSVSKGKGTCGISLERDKRIIIENVEQSPIFAGTPALDIQLRAGVHAVQSTPLISRSGKMVGMFSTYYRRPFRPDEYILRMLDLLALQAADIIVHAHAEKALRLSEERFAKAFHSNPVAIAIISLAEGRVLDVNSKLLTLFGYQRHETIGKTTLELGIWCSATQRDDAIGEFYQCGSIRSREELFCKKSGQKFTARLCLDPIKLGQVDAAIITFEDISERKKAESDLRQSEALLRAVTDHNQDPIFLKDRNSRMLFANPATLHFIGKPAEEVIGKTDEEFYDRREDGLRMMANDRKVIASGAGIVIEEVISNPDGSKNYFITSKSPWYDKQGQIAGIVGVAHEITKRKLAEQTLLHRTEELIAANKELESFSYSVSHDLRTPLRAIKGFTDILLEDYAEIVDNEGRDLLRRIHKSTERMVAIIDDMLRLTRISREAIQRKTIDLKPLVSAIIDSLRQHNPGRNVTINITDRLPAFADEQLITIALSNLIGNAWKYTSRNPTPQIDISYMQKENTSVFCIRDNGAGFDMNLSHKLFEPFQRLHSDEIFPGTGTGLAIVRKIIECHNGKIWAESEPGKGAAFLFTLEPAKPSNSTMIGDSNLFTAQHRSGPLYL